MGGSRNRELTYPGRHINEVEAGGGEREEEDEGEEGTVGEPHQSLQHPAAGSAPLHTGGGVNSAEGAWWPARAASLSLSVCLSVRPPREDDDAARAPDGSGSGRGRGHSRDERRRPRPRAEGGKGAGGGAGPVGGGARRVAMETLGRPLCCVTRARKDARARTVTIEAVGRGRARVVDAGRRSERWR